MKKRLFIIAIVIALILSLGLPTFANDEEDKFLSYEELVKTLKQIERSSKGNVELEVIGETNEGRDIYMATVGSGPKTVMIMTQQHGNEPHGTEAAVRILRFLGTGSKQAKAITDKLTVRIIVRVNPDGGERFWRQNVDWRAPAGSSAHGFDTSGGRGWDINRYHWVDWTQSSLYQYNHPGIMTEQFGLIAGRLPVGSTRDYSEAKGNLIDCGFGGVGDFPTEVAGNIALIERGQETFANMVSRARAADAVGIIVFNSVAGLPSLNISSSVIPVMLMFREDGLIIREVLQTDQEIYAEFTNAYPANPVPEAQAVIDAFQKYEPIWMIDVHNQGRYIDPDGKDVTSSILWPTNPNVSTEAVTLSKQMCAVIMDHMEQYGYANVKRYPGGAGANIARNSYGLMGVGSVLIEIKGSPASEEKGMLVRHTQEQLMGVIQATADGSLYEKDPNRTDELPGEYRSYEEE